MPEIRMPTQKRSIEKRNKIIEKGFELMCEKGFYNTTTIDIAEYAGVSIGIIYQYFNDKKDIFLEGVRNYSANIMYPMLNMFKMEKFDIENLNTILKNMLDKFIKSHKISKKAHEELMAMSHLDEEVSNVFKNSEIEMTEKIVKLIQDNNINIKNSREKIHIIIGLIDNFCHEVVYHRHKNIDYEVMKKEVILSIISILK